jgi:phosphohistidine phosphatase
VKSLLFLRHGKSDWNTDVDDAERPLAKRGERAARIMGEFLTRAGQAPDAVVTSRARRAVDTALLAAAAGEWPCEVRRSDEIYGADSSGVLQAVRAEEDTTTRLLLVGHEPATSETIALLVGGGAFRLPTAGLAAIELDVQHWAEVEAGCGCLLFLIPPRLLAAR